MPIRLNINNPDRRAKLAEGGDDIAMITASAVPSTNESTCGNKGGPSQSFVTSRIMNQEIQIITEMFIVNESG